MNTSAHGGSLRLCIWNYRAYKGKLGDQFAVSGYSGDRTYPLEPNSESEWFRLSDTPRTFTCVLTPKQGTGLIIPRVYADKDSTATVTEFRMELLPPDGNWREQ